MAVERGIPEFTNPYPEATYLSRLQGTHLILVAEDSTGRLVGFKVGYALDEHTFYSWVGGVLPDARRGRVARMLMEAQEVWVAEQGFFSIRVKSKNVFPHMLMFLISRGYAIIGTEGVGPGCKIVFSRALND
jgi:ribosomal protein S18 acetylase RimI-like enzyme